MKEILQDLLDDLEFFVNSRESNKDVKHIDEIIKKYKNKAINYSQCCKSDSELLPTKDDVYSEIKRVTELYYNDDNVRKSAFGLGFSTGVNFVNKDMLK